MFSGKGKVAKQSSGAGQGDSNAASAGVLKRPEVVLVYKMIIIGIVSFAFAAFTTFVYATNFS